MYPGWEKQNELKTFHILDNLLASTCPLTICMASYCLLKCWMKLQSLESMVFG
jgi:hypothetical protein